MVTGVFRPGTAVLSLTRDELDMIHMALNEPCHGDHFPISEFQTRVGFEREVMLSLMERLFPLGQSSANAPSLT